MAERDEIPMTIDELRVLRDSLLRYVDEYAERLSEFYDVHPLFTSVEFIMQSINDLKSV